MSNIYQLLTSARVSVKTFTDEEINNAKLDNSKNASKEASKMIAEYVFHPFEGDEKNLYLPVSAEIITQSDKDGNDFNKVEITEKDGGKYRLSLYGSEKKVLPNRKFTTEELKNLVFGYCTSGNEVITNNRIKNGVVTKVRRDYCNISAV